MSQDGHAEADAIYHARYFLIVMVFLAPANARAQALKPHGPPGGGVRVLAADPSRPTWIFFGTADGHIFGSEDAGAQWTLLGGASSRLDAVIIAIVVDPRDGDEPASIPPGHPSF